MTREEMLNMSAGRELDALVAEKVMGWHIGDAWGGSYWVDSDLCSRYEVINFKPSQHINIAWEVVEKFPIVNISRVEVFEKFPHHAVEIFFDMETNEPSRAEATTAPEAICKAALLAVMEVDE